MDYGITTLLSAIVSYITFVVILFILLHFRLDRRKMRLLFAVLCGLCGMVWFLTMQKYPVGGYTVLPVFLCLAVPTTVAALLTARYRDARFWFTYLSAGVLAVCMQGVGKAVELLAGGTVVLSIKLVLLPGLFYFFLKIQQRYWEMMEVKEERWTGRAAAAAWFFLAVCAVCFCPALLKKNSEYLPVLVIFCITVLLASIQNLQYVRVTWKYCLSKKEIQQMKCYEKMAYVDELTGLLNRRALDEELQRLEIDRKPFFYLVFDINELKEVNDTYGHMRGDDFIREAASLLKDFGKGALGAYRTGGDEFVLLFPDDVEETETSLDDIRRRSDGFFFSGDKKYGMAVGYGRLENYETDSVDKLMKRSDLEMYRNKFKMKAAKTEKQ